MTVFWKTSLLAAAAAWALLLGGCALCAPETSAAPPAGSFSAAHTAGNAA